MSDTSTLLKNARVAAARLERVTPDSSWAHRASGLRRVVIRYADRIDAGGYLSPREQHRFRRVIQQSFRVLEQAAREKSQKRGKDENGAI